MENLNIKSNYNDTDKISYLLSLGYTLEDIKFITKRTKALLTNSISSIKNKIDNLLKLGFTHDRIIKMTKICPQIFTLSTNKINNKVKYILSLGYSIENIVISNSKINLIYLKKN